MLIPLAPNRSSSRWSRLVIAFVIDADAPFVLWAAPGADGVASNCLGIRPIGKHDSEQVYDARR